jgi:hypothetical protein
VAFPRWERRVRFRPIADTCLFVTVVSSLAKADVKDLSELMAFQVVPVNVGYC